MTFLKPKDQKKTRPGIRVNRDGSEVCLTKSQWDKRRWELYVIAHNDGGSCCFKCGAKLDFNENFHAHHSRGTRGHGGGLRDDRIFIPYVGTEDEWKADLLVLYEKFPFMPAPPLGLMWNLYPLCNNCHQEEHEQGCNGKLHWSGNAHDNGEGDEENPSTTSTGDQASFDLTTDGDQPEASERDHQEST